MKRIHFKWYVRFIYPVHTFWRALLWAWGFKDKNHCDVCGASEPKIKIGVSGMASVCTGCIEIAHSFLHKGSL